jgi:hypothetical protein
MDGYSVNRRWKKQPDGFERKSFEITSLISIQGDQIEISGDVIREVVSSAAVPGDPPAPGMMIEISRRSS